MPASKKTIRLVSAEQAESPAAVSEQVSVESPVAAVQSDASQGPRLRVTLCKSGTGYKYDQKRTLAALGLKRLNMTVEQPDNPSIRGMLAKVQHLVRVEEIGQV